MKTTIELPDGLLERAAKVAAQYDQTATEFLLEAMTASVEGEEPPPGGARRRPAFDLSKAMADQLVKALDRNGLEIVRKDSSDWWKNG